MAKFTPDKAFIKKILKMSFPLMLQEALAILMITVSTLIIGSFSQDGANAASPILSVYFLFHNINFGFVALGNLFIAQHFGRGAMDKVEKDYYLIVKLSLILSLIMFISLFFFSRQIVGLFLPNSTPQAETILNLAESYGKIFSFSFFFSGITNINACLFKNIKLEKYPSYISLGSLILFIGLDFLFLYGVFKNIQGAGYAYLITRIIECAVSSIVLYIKSRRLFNYSFKSFIKINLNDISIYTKSWVPLLIGKTLFAFGQLIATMMIARLNADTLTAVNGLMNSMRNIICCAANGFAASVAIVLGRELGANRSSKACYHADNIFHLLRVFPLISVVAFWLTFLINVAIVKNGNYPNDSLHMLFIVYFINTIFVYCQFWNTTCTNGMLNAGGDTFILMIIDSTSNLCILVPIAIIGLHFNWNPLVILIILCGDEMLKFPLFIIRSKSKKWARNVINSKGIVFNE